MTDLEITKLCAEARGWVHLGAIGVNHERTDCTPWCLSGANDWWKDPEGNFVCNYCTASVPDPLHDDAQTMALVKLLKLTILYNGPFCHSAWTCTNDFENDSKFDTDSDDLSRAICECVAKMQKAA